MLVEVKCEKFLDGTLSFHEGLNVILGDEKATNSIGKSNALMVVDFIFGGNAFTSRNRDVMDALGDHAYYFCFEFNKIRYHFRRETYDPKVIYRCDAEYKEISTIDLDSFGEFLSKEYGVGRLPMSFRSIVGIYSRVWGKDNLDVKKPLHADKNQKESEAIKTLIKLFDEYAELEKLSEDWEHTKAAKRSLAQASTFEYVPKINKADFQKNETKITSIDNEIDEIKKNLAKHACDLNELVNREMLDLKEQKDALLELDMDINNRLRRVRNNLSKNGFLRSKNLKSLQEFFPDANVEKISKIETFHEGLKEILKDELKASEKTLEERLKEIRAALKKIDAKIATVVNGKIGDADLIIERVLKLYDELRDARQENSFYAKEKDLAETAKTIKETLVVKKQRVLDKICGQINNTVRAITTAVYSKDRKAPKLEIKDSQYNYETGADRGTGKAYSDLIMFDLSIFKLTQLPILIHDSLLFKNIENDAVKQIVKTYAENTKQVFIAIDEIKKYGGATEKIIRDNTILELSNSRLLYKKDWRTKG